MDEHFPRYVVWETTLACNLACRHCGSSAGRARRGELTPAECFRLIDDLAGLGAEELTFSGGELVLRPDWRDLLSRAAALGIRCLVVTNGYAIDRETAGEFARCGVAAVTVSIDGGAAVHDDLRPAAGASSFARVLSAIANLREAGVATAAITQVSSGNVGELEAIARILRDHGVKAWQIQITNPMGRASRPGSPGATVCALRPSRLPAVYDFIRRVQDAGGIRCLAADNIGYFGPDEHFLRSDGERGARFWTGCQAGLRVLGLTSDGGVKGCLSMPDSLLEGNVRDRALREIWADPGSFAYNRRFRPEDLTGACRGCEFGKLCRAGCHSLSATAVGRLTENPYCVRLVRPAGGQMEKDR